MKKNTIGSFLTEKRKECNLTLKQFADKLFVSESTVCKWEKDKSQPNLATVKKICETLNISEKEFLTACDDSELKTTKKKAKAWTNLTNTTFSILWISSALAILTSFIVNLATTGNLTWFFIVLSSVALFDCITILPMFIKKHKFFISASATYLAFVLLMLTLVLFTSGDWFFIVTIGSTLLFIAVSLPIFIKIYPVHATIKKFNFLITLAALFVFTLIELAIVNSYVGGDWFFSFALGVSALAYAIPLIVYFISSSKKMNKLVKWGISLSALSVYFYLGTILIYDWASNVFNFTNTLSMFPNFSDWSAASINMNVTFIVAASSLLLGLIFVISGLIKKTKK